MITDHQPMAERPEWVKVTHSRFSVVEIDIPFSTEGMFLARGTQRGAMCSACGVSKCAAHVEHIAHTKHMRSAPNVEIAHNGYLEAESEFVPLERAKCIEYVAHDFCTRVHYRRAVSSQFGYLAYAVVP